MRDIYRIDINELNTLTSCPKCGELLIIEITTEPPFVCDKCGAQIEVVYSAPDGPRWPGGMGNDQI